MGHGPGRSADCRTDSFFRADGHDAKHNGFTSRPVQNEGLVEADEAAVVGQVVQCGCKKGYQLADGPQSAKCLETGSWNVTETPTCKIVKCPHSPAIQNGRLKGIVKNEYVFMDKVDYVCDPGFRMTNEDHLTCTATGEWDDQVPACIRAVCLCVDILEDGLMD